MSKYDDQIEQALRAESDDVWSELEEQGLFEQALDVMRGRQKAVAALGYVFMFVFFAMMIYTGWRFFGSETTKAQIAWAVGFIFANSAVAMLKLWFFMQMDRNRILREVKRLELQVATLAGLMRSKGSADRSSAPAR